MHWLRNFHTFLFALHFSWVQQKRFFFGKCKKYIKKTEKNFALVILLWLTKLLVAVSLNWNNSCWSNKNLNILDRWMTLRGVKRNGHRVVNDSSNERKVLVLWLRHYKPFSSAFIYWKLHVKMFLCPKPLKLHWTQ